MTNSTPVAVETSEIAGQVKAGLTKRGQKELNPTLLYDAVGSALFEAITYLPEYGLTRAEERLFAAHASEMIMGLGDSVVIAELGSGAGRKTRRLLEAMENPPVYCPIDVSASALSACAKEMHDLASVRPIHATYLEGIAEVVATRRPSERLFVLFLGSTIGNFAPGEAVVFLEQLRSHLQNGDRLLLGADLVKDEAVLLRAYDDPVGVTAAFNRNVLARINRELEAGFQLELFEHQARFDPERDRVEMHLRAKRAHTVDIGIPGYSVRFEQDETIWTESSYKFRAEDMEAMARYTGFEMEAAWIDEPWRFAEFRWTAV